MNQVHNNYFTLSLDFINSPHIAARHLVTPTNSHWSCHFKWENDHQNMKKKSDKLNCVAYTELQRRHEQDSSQNHKLQTSISVIYTHALN